MFKMGSNLSFKEQLEQMRDMTPLQEQVREMTPLLVKEYNQNIQVKN